MGPLSHQAASWVGMHLLFSFTWTLMINTHYIWFKWTVPNVNYEKYIMCTLLCIWISWGGPSVPWMAATSSKEHFRDAWEISLQRDSQVEALHISLGKMDEIRCSYTEALIILTCSGSFIFLCVHQRFSVIFIWDCRGMIEGGQHDGLSFKGEHEQILPYFLSGLRLMFYFNSPSWDSRNFELYISPPSSAS